MAMEFDEFTRLQKSDKGIKNWSSAINLYGLIFFWLRWVFVVVRRLSLVEGSRGYSSLQYAGFSLRWLLLLWSTGCRRAGSVEHRLSSCGARI